MNEAPNIQRTLAALSWASDIVVVDSGSTDGTLQILASHKKVRVFHRKFDTHSHQWHFAITETGIASEWILRLDADYEVTPELIAEITALPTDGPYSAYEIKFGYAVFGYMLRGSLYPANAILFRRGRVTVFDKGHTEGWSVDGPVFKLKSTITHNDWKPAHHWVESQARYMFRELPYLHANRGGLKSWLRRQPPLMPIAVFLYCLFGKGLVLDGRAGLFYALQRLLAETALSLMVIEERLKHRSNNSAERDSR